MTIIMTSVMRAAARVESDRHSDDAKRMTEEFLGFLLFSFFLPIGNRDVIGSSLILKPR